MIPIFKQGCLKGKTVYKTAVLYFALSVGGLGIVSTGFASEVMPSSSNKPSSASMPLDQKVNMMPGAQSNFPKNLDASSNLIEEKINGKKQSIEQEVEFFENPKNKKQPIIVINPNVPTNDPTEPIYGPDAKIPLWESPAQLIGGILEPEKK